MATRGAENNFRSSTNVVPEQQFQEAGNTLAQDLAPIGKEIIRQGQEAKINENFSSVQVEVNNLDRQFQVDWAHDPFNKDALAKLKQDKDDIYQSNSEGISPFFKRPYDDAVRKFDKSSAGTIEAFGYAQTRKNTVGSINKSIANNLSQATIDGESGVSVGKAMINFQASKEALVQTADGILSEPEATALLEDFDQDYLKMFLSGKATADPIGALKLLESDKIKDGFTDKKQYGEMKKALQTKVLNIGKVRAEQEVLGVLKSENAMLFQSSEKQIPYAELQQNYAQLGVSKQAQKLINKMNGYGATSEQKLTASEKVDFSVQLFDDIAALQVAEEVKAGDIKAVQNRIYEGLDNKSLSSAAGRSALSQLVEPAIAGMEKDMETYSVDSWKPWLDVGFAGVKERFDDDLAIDAEDSPLTKSKLKQVNNANRLRLYQGFYSALESFMPQGVAMADIGTLDEQTKNTILENAENQALKDYAFKSFGYESPEGQTKRQLVNAIQSEEENKRRVQAQNIVQEAYKKQPVGFEIMEDANGNRARVYDDGRIEEIN